MAATVPAMSRNVIAGALLLVVIGLGIVAWGYQQRRNDDVVKTLTTTRQQCLDSGADPFTC